VKNLRVLTHVLHPLPRSEWINISSKTRKSNPAAIDADTASVSSASTISDGEDMGISQSEFDDEGIMVDANREIRAKLYMGHVRFAYRHIARTNLTLFSACWYGKIPMGWFWFIPAFHMPPFPGSISHAHEPELIHLKLKKSELDFPLTVGSYILDVDVALQWVV
jgi:phosphatidylinositol-3,4,5-trisphosphate 3-phosphatase/dual-specificity protein phosphatase PTEN